MVSTSNACFQKHPPLFYALRLLEKIDLEGRIVTGDAMFCQKTIAYRIVEKGGDYILPVKKNQKDLHEEITTAFNEPVFPPRTMARTATTRSRRRA